MRLAGEIAAEYASFAAAGAVAGLVIAFALRFTSFSDSTEVYLMSFSAQSVIAMFAATVLLSLVISILPIIRVYREDLSQKIK